MDIQFISVPSASWWTEFGPAITGFFGGAAVFVAQWIRDVRMKSESDRDRAAIQLAASLRAAYAEVVIQAREAIANANAWALSFLFKESPLVKARPAADQADAVATLDKHRAALEEARTRLRGACAQLVFWEMDQAKRKMAESIDSRLRKLMSEFMIGEGDERRRLDAFVAALGGLTKDVETFIESLATDGRLKAV